MTTATKNFLDGAYDLVGAEATQAHYDDWAASYEAELLENGYVTPTRCAAALAAFAPATWAPVLDIGCGTGLSGLALVEAGFEAIDGIDLSPEMLAKAEQKQIYRNLSIRDVGAIGEAETGGYENAMAAGVLNPGHAPPETILQVLELLPPQGCFVFSLNDHALADPAFEGRIMDVTDCGLAELMFKEYGDHIPGTGLRAQVYVLRKR